MARCSGSHVCNCNIHGGRGITVKGSGAWNDPYTIDGETTGNLTVQDTGTIALTLSGQGNDDNPYLLVADATISLAELDNVSTGNAQFGDVLGFDGNSWGPRSPTTAAPGAVLSEAGIRGDGSVNRPLVIDLADDSGLVADSDGLRLHKVDVANVEVHTGTFAPDGDQNLGENGTEYRMMPSGTASFDAPSWARSVLVEMDVQALWCSAGLWAGAVGRMDVRYHGDDHFSDGIAMFSMRPGGVERGSTVGYRAVSRFADLSGNETINVTSQMRATNIKGTGTMRSESGNTRVIVTVTWSDQP
jgi:hypothetical protein